MTQPNIHVVDALVDLVNSEWDSSNVTDEYVVIGKSDEIGKGRDVGTYDYVEFSVTSPTNISYADLFMSTQDVDVAVFVEIKSSSSARRDVLFDEFRRIIEANRQRPETPGDFDRMIFQDVTPLDDQSFGAYTYEVVVAFESRSRTV
jgi:hypothetical protein